MWWSDMLARKLEERMHQQLKSVLKRVRALPESRQWEIAEVLLASLDQQSPDVHLSPRKLAKIERDAASHSRFATDEQVRAVFARLTNKESPRVTAGVTP
jgi:hypothetical protein